MADPAGTPRDLQGLMNAMFDPTNNALKISGGAASRKLRVQRYKGGSDVTSTSAAKVAVDAVNLPFVTVAGCAVGDIIRCSFRAAVTSSAQSAVGFDIEVDQPTSANVWVGDFPSAGYAANATTEAVIAFNVSVPFVATYTVTEAGTHGFRIGWRTSGGTVTMVFTGTFGQAAELVVENLGPEVS